MKIRGMSGQDLLVVSYCSDLIEFVKRRGADLYEMKKLKICRSRCEPRAHSFEERRSGAVIGP